MRHSCTTAHPIVHLARRHGGSTPSRFETLPFEPPPATGELTKSSRIRSVRSTSCMNRRAGSLDLRKFAVCAHEGGNRNAPQIFGPVQHRNATGRCSPIVPCSACHSRPLGRGDVAQNGPDSAQHPEQTSACGCLLERSFGDLMGAVLRPVKRLAWAFQRATAPRRPFQPRTKTTHALRRSDPQRTGQRIIAVL